MFIIIASFLMAWLFIFRIYNPMRMPAPIIRIHVLRHTPIGMHIDEAMEIIGSNEGWGTPAINRNNGFFHPSRFVDEPDGSITRAIIGDQSIQTRVRMYGMMPFHGRNVRILWGFDISGNLIDVYVSSIFSP